MENTSTSSSFCMTRCVCERFPCFFSRAVPMAKENVVTRLESDERVRSLFMWTTGALIFLEGIIARPPNKESNLLVRFATCQLGFCQTAVFINLRASTDWSK